MLRNIYSPFVTNQWWAGNVYLDGWSFYNACLLIMIMKGKFVLFYCFVLGVGLAYFHVSEEFTDFKNAFRQCATKLSRLPRGQTKEELKNISHKMMMYNISAVWLNITFSRVDSDKKIGKN